MDVPPPLPPWPPGYEDAQLTLGDMIARRPHFEGAWYTYILTMVIYVYPAIAPNLYYVRQDCILREPIDADAADAADGRTSIDSYGNDVRGREPGQGQEPKILKPDFVVVQGRRGQQRTVLLIEVKNENCMGPGDAERFHRYCIRVVEFGDRASHTVVMLIAGGIVYTWRRPELPALIMAGPLTSVRMAVARSQPGRCVRVDSPAFIDLLIRIREEFAQHNPM
jgi:hypothetical protein